MITAHAKIPTFATEYALSVFPIQDKNLGVGGRSTYDINLNNAQFVRIIRDIANDPMVTKETTTQELYKLYPRLKKVARNVLWHNPLKVNWDLESPLAIEGFVMYRETPKSKTICIDIGKTTLRF